MEGYTTQDSGEPTHNHKKCIFLRTPTFFGWRIFIYYGCMGHSIQLSKDLNDMLGRIVYSIRLPYTK